MSTMQVKHTSNSKVAILVFFYKRVAVNVVRENGTGIVEMIRS